MDLFDLFSGLLSGPVGDNKDNHPDDVRRTKNNLKNAGYFDDNEDDTENPILTRQMDDGIKAFQKDKKLKVDGIMTPGGETERGLFETLTRRKADEVFGRADDESGSIGFGGNVSGTLERPKPDTGKRAGFAESFINPPAEKEAAEKDAALLPIRLTENDPSRPDLLEGKSIEYDATGRMIKPEKNKNSSSMSPILKEKLLSPELERIAQNYLIQFKKNGLKQSERFFKNYLGGTGKSIRLTPQEIDDTPTFKKAIQINQKRFEDSMAKGLVDAKLKEGKFVQKVEGTPSRFKDQILNLKDGESTVLKNENVPGGVDFWDRDISFFEGAMQGDTDQSGSTGSIKLRSSGSFRATRKGNIVEIDGVVDNNIKDIYNFDNENIVDKIVFEPFRRMATEGNAKPFLVYGSRLRRLRGFLEIENDRIKNSNFKWEDINR